MDENASKQDKNPLPLDRSDDENENTGGIAKAQPQATPRQPPPGWAGWRRKGSLLIPENENVEEPVDSNKTSDGAQKLTIAEARSLADEEFHSID